ncbi:MAG: type II/IV secretion system ATPase subunit, partial [Candidatus Thermoplasmatota archaeon]
METQVAFPKFVQALKDCGAASVHGAAFLSDPNGAWRAIEPAVRAAFLAPLGMQDGPELMLRIGKKPDAPKSLDNVLVTIQAAALAPVPPTRSASAAESAPTPGVAAAPAPRSRKQKKQAPTPTTPPAAPEAPAPAPESTPAPQPAPAPEPMPEIKAETDSTPSPEARPTGLKGMLGRFKGNRKKPDASASPEAATWQGTITEVEPPSEPGLNVIETYAVQEPYAYVRILYNQNTHEHLYETVEPKLTERESNILAFIENTIVDVIEIGLSAITKESAAELLRKHADEVIYDYSIVLTALSREKILYYILRDFLGFGKLDPIMRDEFIEDVSCDGPDVPIFLYHRKYESLKSTVKYQEEQELDSYVIKMAQRSGKHVSIADPLLDATLPDGSRLNATLSDEVTSGGSTFTIRKFKEDPFTLPDLVRSGTMNEDLLAYWWLAVQNGASAIYAGGTASG